MSASPLFDSAKPVQAVSALALFIWLLNVAVDTTGHMAFKIAAGGDDHASELDHWKAMASRPPLWIGIVCFTAEFVLWLILLSILPLSIGVLLGAINMVAIVVAGRLLFGEKIDRNRAIGLALITFGVALVGRFA